MDLSRKSLLSRQGSAYLFVIGTLTVVMLLLLSSLRRSSEGTKHLFIIQDHWMVRNIRDSCTTWIFHKIKTWPFDKKGNFHLAENELEMGLGQCVFSSEFSDSRRFDFKILARYKALEKEIWVEIKGQESSRGIQWSMQAKKPESLQE
jgi:hypothetical protein